MQHRWRSLVVLILSVGALLPVPAQPVQWPASQGGNGHAYEVVAMFGSISWTAADLAATAAGGYLATITSAAENAFLFNVVNAVTPSWNGSYGPWLGGTQPQGSPEPAGGWQWVTGEPWSYTNWNPGEPNNLGNEDSLHFKLTSGGWNDESSAGGSIWSYVVEYDGFATFDLVMSAPFGTGSLQIDNLAGTPGSPYVTLLTVNQGNFPNGAVAGIDISTPELLWQLTYGLPPFVGILDGGGCSGYMLGPFMLPTGLTLYGVSAELEPVLGYPVAVTSPTSFTIP